MSLVIAVITVIVTRPQLNSIAVLRGLHILLYAGLQLATDESPPNFRLRLRKLTRCMEFTQVRSRLSVFTEIDQIREAIRISGLGD